LKFTEGGQKFSLSNQNFGNFQRQSLTNLISNEKFNGSSINNTSQSFVPDIILGENSNSTTFKVSKFKVENKKKKRKEMKKVYSKRSVKQVKNKTPSKIKKPLDTGFSKKFENSLRNSNFGLKEISKKVKEIVKKLKKTTYKEISDLIVCQLNEKDGKDEKNIRRRIYDSLNVMKAMNLFEKDSSNKFIHWKGEKSDQASNDNLTLSNFSFKKRKRSLLEEEDLENKNLSSEELRFLIVIY
jgi:hypothetical protein